MEGCGCARIPLSSIKEVSNTAVTLRRGSVRWLTTTALFMGMNVILSLSTFSIPVPGGHLYFCDAVIDTAAILLDPFAAFVVGGIGSFLGDFFFYPAPMFVSLVTHGLQAVIVSVISHKLLTKKPVVSSSIAVIVGAVIMVVGYTLGRAYVYSTPEYAILKLPFEILQAGFGAVVSIILLYPMRIGALFQRILHD
ncbi:MAG: ECF transporter S component [Clostridia bacterium]|nr:ECF transporter S component [Clostridia bacterium]